MNSPTRTLHDSAEFLRKVLGIKLRVVSEGVGVQKTPLQKAGEALIDNTVEADFYGLPEKQIKHEWPDVPCYRLKNAYVVGDTGQIFLSDGSLFLPTFYPHEHLLPRMKVRRPLPLLARKISGTVFHLTGRNHDNRGHFLMQHLPRLLEATPLLEQHPDHRILVAPNHARWQKRYIEMVGHGPERVIEGSQGTLQVEDLIYVPHIYGSHALVSPQLCRAIRDAALRQVDSTLSGSSLFISRSDAPDKRLHNEDAVIETVREVLGDVRVIHLGQHSLQEQIQMFSSAPVVVGPIGQGLCNNLFMRNNLLISMVPGTSIDGHMGNGHTTISALACENKAITLCSGILDAAGNNRSNWTFPIPSFKEQMTRLMSHPHLDGVRQRLRPRAD
ncbi:MAG: Capsular polysaccharide biosynthesis protein [Prosthecobacter sp.]|nr:Capsular polysaccharide biosynthesis protein [Prosthecobacter sp.]